MKYLLTLLVCFLTGCATSNISEADDVKILLEEISKLSNREEVTNYWNAHNWPLKVETCESLKKLHSYIPDPKYYPFTERFEAVIPLGNRNGERVIWVFVNSDGKVTYRRVEVRNRPLSW